MIHAPVISIPVLGHQISMEFDIGEAGGLKQVAEIVPLWKAGLARFRKLRRKYLLYK